MTTETVTPFLVHLYSNCTHGDRILRDETVMIAKVTCTACIARREVR